MRTYLFPRFKFPLLALTVLVLASIACGQSATKELAEASEPSNLAILAPTATVSQQEPQTTENTASAVIPQPTIASIAIVQPTTIADNVEQPTVAVLPAPVSASEPLKLLTQGFGQDERYIGFAFFVENANQNIAIESSNYQIAFYAPDGTVVETESGYIELVMPGQKLGVGGEAIVDEGITVAGIEVQISTGDAVLFDPVPGFAMEMVEYKAGDYSSYAVGVIRSSFSLDISNLRVSAVVFDEANNIIGGGFTYANFIRANGSRGIKVSVASLPNVSRVEIYPTVSGLSDIKSPDILPEGTGPLAILRQGYGQDETTLAFGIVVQNPNGNYSIETSEYYATAFSADGRVLGVEEGYINVVLPGQTLGIAGSSYLINAEAVARLEVEVQTDEFVPSDPLPVFTAENISYLPGDYSSSVTGQIVNPYPRDISNLRVDAILYDGAGSIIGSGYTYLDFVPATSRSAVEVSVDSSGQPSGVELYATVSGISEIK